MLITLPNNSLNHIEKIFQFIEGEKMAKVEVTGVERWSKRKRKKGWKRRWELEVEEEVELGVGIGRRWRQRWKRKGQGVIRRRKIVENVLSWIRRMVGEAGRER